MKEQRHLRQVNEKPPDPPDLRNYSEADKQWWATYNAAVVGLYSASDETREGLSEAEADAHSLAKFAHGFVPRSYKGSTE